MTEAEMRNRLQKIILLLAHNEKVTGPGKIPTEAVKVLKDELNRLTASLLELCVCPDAFHKRESISSRVYDVCPTCNKPGRVK